MNTSGWLVTYSLWACGVIGAFWVVAGAGVGYLWVKHFVDEHRRKKVVAEKLSGPTDAEWVLAEAEQVVRAAEREMGLL